MIYFNANNQKCVGAIFKNYFICYILIIFKSYVKVKDFSDFSGLFEVIKLLYAITNCQLRQCKTRRYVNQRDN